MLKVDGTVFEYAYGAMNYAIDYVRRERKPILVHATVPLLNHHTSGVRKEFYRSKEDLEKHQAHDPFIKLKTISWKSGITETKFSK